MASFKLLNYAGVNGEARQGIRGWQCNNLVSAGLGASTYELLQDWKANHDRLTKIADGAASIFDL